jgi:hypothetical protein
MIGLAFEPEVALPARPYEAAIIYLALLAYPEPDAGQESQPGSRFANALASAAIWRCTKARGLRYIREQRNEPAYVAPKKREFEGAFDRGMRRIYRRGAAYDLVGTRLMRGFFAATALGQKAIKEGRIEEAYHLHPNSSYSPLREEVWDKAMPSIRKVIGSSGDHWSQRLSLNTTGAPADRSQKAKDDYERGFRSSVPVLHMMHGLNQAMHVHGKSIPRWGEREPVMAMMMNAEIWIHDAVEWAEQWRQLAHHGPGMSLGPDDMVALSWQATDATGARLG